MMELPKKSHFKQDEVCTLTGVKPYVLRFWESEFEQISPILSSSGQKLYEHQDIEAILQVKECLFDKKMTIEQAKRRLVQADDFLAAEEQELPALPDDISIDEKLVLAKSALAQLVRKTELFEQSFNRY